MLIVKNTRHTENETLDISECCVLLEINMSFIGSQSGLYGSPGVDFNLRGVHIREREKNGSARDVNGGLREQIPLGRS